MTRMQRSSGKKRTAGFSLVELLVVIAIIAILVSLTAAAVFKVIGVQQSSNTQLTVRTASSQLDKKWAAVISRARNEQIPNTVMNIAGNDPVRARVIWIKLRLKQEFPMNLTEALVPSSLPLPLINLVTSTNPGSGIFVLQSSDLPNKPSYIDALKRAASISGAAFSVNSDPTLWPLESSFTLAMILGEENFAVNALANEIFNWQAGPPPQPVKLALSGPRMVIDAWGTPLQFYRWPVGNNDFLSTTPGSPVSTTARASAFPDPLDPQGTLLDPRWNNAANWSAAQGVWWFEKYCHTIHTVSVKGVYTPLALYTEPVIISAGPDHVSGLQPAPTLLPTGVVWTDSTTKQPILAPNLPDEMNVSVTNNNSWFDNVASYKLRTGATGDK